MIFSNLFFNFGEKILQNQPDSIGVDYNDSLDTEDRNTRVREPLLLPLTLQSFWLAQWPPLPAEAVSNLPTLQFLSPNPVPCILSR